MYNNILAVILLMMTLLAACLAILVFLFRKEIFDLKSDIRKMQEEIKQIDKVQAVTDETVIKLIYDFTRYIEIMNKFIEAENNED